MLVVLHGGSPRGPRARKGWQGGLEETMGLSSNYGARLCQNIL
jgi:hypothetical protein